MQFGIVGTQHNQNIKVTRCRVPEAGCQSLQLLCQLLQAGQGSLTKFYSSMGQGSSTFPVVSFVSVPWLFNPGFFMDVVLIHLEKMHGGLEHPQEMACQSIMNAKIEID